MSSDPVTREAEGPEAGAGTGARPAAVPPPCTCAAIRRAARRVTQLYDEALRPAGLRLTQYSMLATLARSEGLSITDLAARLEMDRTTLTRNLKPLERAGWVGFGDLGDARCRGVVLTPDGHAVLERARPRWLAVEQTFRREIGADDAAALRALLERALERLPAAAPQ